MKICICGGGNLGHVIAGFTAARGFEVNVLTSQPERWHKSITVKRPDHWLPLIGQLSCVSSRPEEVVAGADIVLLCLPGYAIRNTLLKIKDHLRQDYVNGTAVGSVVSSTGFFFQAMEVLPPKVPLFGLQRVPFIARTLEYGHVARLMGYKDSLRLAVENAGAGGKEVLRQTMERMFRTPTCLMDNFYEVSLSNSNPLLHPARLYDLWSNWQEGQVYARVPLFYEEWTEQAAQLYLDMDNELQQLLDVLPVRKGSIPSVLKYYESTDVPSLARKLRSIEAFKGIPAPMKETAGGYVPDFQSRYFTEDFPYGLAIVQRLAHEKGVSTPVIDRVCQWRETLPNLPEGKPLQTSPKGRDFSRFGGIEG